MRPTIPLFLSTLCLTLMSIQAQARVEDSLVQHPIQINAEAPDVETSKETTEVPQSSHAESLLIRRQKPHFLGVIINWPEFLGLNYHYNLDEYWALGATGSQTSISISGRRYLGTDASAAYLELSPAYHYSNFFYGGSRGPSFGLYGRYGYEMRGDWLTMDLSIGPGLVRQSDSSIWFMVSGGLSIGATF